MWRRLPIRYQYLLDGLGENILIGSLVPLAIFFNCQKKQTNKHTDIAEQKTVSGQVHILPYAFLVGKTVL